MGDDPTADMKTVRYSPGDPWTGDMQCPQCAVVTHAWRSSGMSDCRPHFYCDSCSNVLFRQSDWGLVYQRGSNAEVLAEIARTLPACPCGGRFTPGANPKCSACRAEFAHQNDVVARLDDPQMIVVDEACVCGDGDERVASVRYRVRFSSG